MQMDAGCSLRRKRQSLPLGVRCEMECTCVVSVARRLCLVRAVELVLLVTNDRMSFVEPNCLESNRTREHTKGSKLPASLLFVFGDSKGNETIKSSSSISPQLQFQNILVQC
jgi:hypothetical protein